MKDLAISVLLTALLWTSC